MRLTKNITNIFPITGITLLLLVSSVKSCETDEECRQGLPGNLSQCNPEYKRCECIPDKSFLVKGECLEILNELGSPCVNHRQCTLGKPGNHSDCRPSPENPSQLTCQCNPDAYNEPGSHVCCQRIPEDKTYDLKSYQNLFENIGDDCKVDSDCPTNAACTGKCTCKNDYVASIPLDRCLVIVSDTTTPCEEPQQCQFGRLGEFSHCKDERCRCTEEYVLPDGPDGFCLRKATSVGGACEHNIQCESNLDHSYCWDKKCECNAGAVASQARDKCLLLKGLDEPCTEDVECDHPGRQASCQATDVPNEKKCRCVNGYIPHPVENDAGPRGTCLKIAETIGEPCEGHLNQCGQLEMAVCRQNPLNTTYNTCQCVDPKPVISESQLKCLEMRELTQTCEESGQCTDIAGDAECRLEPPPTTGPAERKCFCKDGFIPGEGVDSKKKCLRVRDNVGLPCEEDIQCRNVSYISDPAEVKCLPKNDPLSTCQCERENTQFHNGNCVTPAKLNETCTHHDNCTLGINENALCLLGRCTCKQEAIIQNGTTCYIRKKVGSRCLNNMECWNDIIGPSRCTANTCVCDEGSYSDNGGLRCKSSGIWVHGGWGNLTKILMAVLVFKITFNSWF